MAMSEDEIRVNVIIAERSYRLIIKKTDEEKVIKIDNFQVLPTNDPKTLKFSFELYNLAGKNVNIGVSI